MRKIAGMRQEKALVDAEASCKCTACTCFYELEITKKDSKRVFKAVAIIAHLRKGLVFNALK